MRTWSFPIVRPVGRGPAAACALVWLTFMLSFVLTPAAAAEGSWLDNAAPETWNESGSDLPLSLGSEVPIDPRFIARERPQETTPDQQLIDAGWRLFSAYQAGWGVVVVNGTSSYDGMGRPWNYQTFIFVDGAFAGTLSPTPMQSRFDGALDSAQLLGPDEIRAQFRRYTESDPLCCPSATTSVLYRIDRENAPVVVPVQATTGEN